MSFDALWEKTYMSEQEDPTDLTTTSSEGSSPQRRTSSSRQSSKIKLPDLARVQTDPIIQRTESKAKPLSPIGSASPRFGALKPSENWTRMRSRSRSGSVTQGAPWRPRSLSTASLPSVDDLRSTGWRPGKSPRVGARRPSGAFVPRRLSGALRPRRNSDRVHAQDAAADIASFKAATNQFVGDPTAVEGSRFKRYVVEVTGDPSGVANGTYYFTEKPSRKPFFTRTAPHKATLAPRQSHGMWFLLCWGEDEDGKKIWTDYCSPHDGELPPPKGWRKCFRTKDKLHWNFGEEVPINVEVLKEALPSYT